VYCNATFGRFIFGHTPKECCVYLAVLKRHGLYGKHTVHPVSPKLTLIWGLCKRSHSFFFSRQGHISSIPSLSTRITISWHRFYSCHLEWWLATTYFSWGSQERYANKPRGYHNQNTTNTRMYADISFVKSVDEREKRLNLPYVVRNFIFLNYVSLIEGIVYTNNR